MFCGPTAPQVGELSLQAHLRLRSWQGIPSNYAGAATGLLVRTWPRDAVVVGQIEAKWTNYDQHRLWRVSRPQVRHIAPFVTRR
jgi:hypothetical protein